MKLFFQFILKIFLILTILIGCETTEEIKETDSKALLNQGIALLKDGQYDRGIAYFNKAIKIILRLTTVEDLPILQKANMTDASHPFIPTDFLLVHRFRKIKRNH